MTTSTCYSPRTEKRILEKQKRRDMVVSDDIADKLHHGFMNDYDRSLLGTSTPAHKLGKFSSPEKLLNSKIKENVNSDGLNKRMEQIIGPYSDIQQLNLTQMQGISFVMTTTPSPGAASVRKDFKDKRKIPPEKQSRNDPLSEQYQVSERCQKPDRSTKCVDKAADQRGKINKRRSCPESRSKDRPVTHRDLKERMRSGDRHKAAPCESFVEFTKVPCSKLLDKVKRMAEVKSETESEDERGVRRRKQEKYADSDRKARLADPQVEDRRRHSSTERCRSRDLENRSRDQSRDQDRSKRKRSYQSWSGADSDIDSDCSTTSSRGQRGQGPAAPLDTNRLSLIFDLMKSSSGEMSPISIRHYRTIRTSSKSSRTKDEDDDEEDEFDISKIEAKLKDEGRLPSSPVYDAMSHSETSDIDSECEFPLSKSTIDITFENVQVKTEPTVKIEKHEDLQHVSSKSRDMDIKSRDIDIKSREINAKSRDSIKGVSVKPDFAIKAEPEDSRFTFPSTSQISVTKTTEDLSAIADYNENRDVKPVVAVNPRVKKPSNETKEPNSMAELLSKISEGHAPDKNLMLDIRKLLSNDGKFDLMVTFGFDKISLRNVRHQQVVQAVKAQRTARNDSDEHSSPDDREKPREKPSCIVPGIPRTDTAKVKQEREGTPLQRVSPRHSPHGEGHEPYHRDERDYHYQRKRRRLTHEPPEYEQYPPPTYHHPYPATVALSSIAYLQLQPSRTDLMMNLMPPPRAQNTFVSRVEEDAERTKLEKAIKDLMHYDQYSERAYAFKKEADPMTNQTDKIMKYLEACIQYVYSALAMTKHKEHQKAYGLLHDTLKIIDYCLQPRSRRGLDVRLQDKRLAVLCLLLVSAIQRQMWSTRKMEFQYLQERCHTFRRNQVKQKDETNRSSHNPTLHNSALNNTTHNLNNSSPTPSPAGSIMSMASYTGTEVLDGGGGGLTSPYESVPQRLLQDTYRYIKLAQHLYDSLEYWNEATQIAQEALAFFSQLDEQCGILKTTSHLYTVARFVGQGLLNLGGKIS